MDGTRGGLGDGRAPAARVVVTGRHRSHSEAETIDLARALTQALGPGAVILLHGDLGAGKTAFVRGVVEAAGGDPGNVSSPTFTLLQPYAGRVTVQHADLYRLTPAEVEDLGLDELADAATIVVVEWADRWRDPPWRAVRVFIDDRGGNERAIRIERATRSGSLAPLS